MVQRCVMCEKGKVVEREEKNHETFVAGQKVVIPEAVVGVCDSCGKVNYAFNKAIARTKK